MDAIISLSRVLYSICAWDTVANFLRNYRLLWMQPGGVAVSSDAYVPDANIGTVTTRVIYVISKNLRVNLWDVPPLH